MGFPSSYHNLPQYNSILTHSQMFRPVIIYPSLIEHSVLNDTTIEERVTILEFQVSGLTEEVTDLGVEVTDLGDEIDVIDGEIVVILTGQVIQDKKILELEADS